MSVLGGGFDASRLRIIDKSAHESGTSISVAGFCPSTVQTWAALRCSVYGVFLVKAGPLPIIVVLVAYRRSIDGRVLAYSCTRTGARSGL